MAKIAAYILLFIFLGIVALWLFWHLLAMAYWVGWMAFWLGLLALVGFAVFSLIKPKLPSFKLKRAPQYKLYDHKQNYVYAFRSEPTVKDIVLLTDELHIAKLELQGDVVQLDTGSTIKIVDDTNKEAIKVQVKGEKAQDKVLWIPRSSMVRSDTDNKKRL